MKIYRSRGRNNGSRDAAGSRSGRHARRSGGRAEWVVIVCCLLGATAHADQPGHAHESGRFSASDGEWPPQPKELENVIWLQPDVSPRAAARARSAETIAGNAPQVQAVLGSRFVYVDEIPEARKKSPSSATRVVYFSHSSNQTVEVTVDGDRIRGVQLIEPGQYQPPLTPAEVGEAVELARTALISGGYPAARALTGYGILAFRTEPMGAFFDRRVAYVSFHAHEDALPQYLAWVDLTDQVVLRTREQ